MSTPQHQVTVRRRGTDEPSYGPSRDLVWLFPQMMMAVGQSLEDGHVEPFIRKFAERNGVTGLDLAAAYYRMAEATCHFTDWEKGHPADAVDEVGLFDAPAAARLVLFAKLGMAALSFAQHHMRGAAASPCDGRILADLQARLERFAGGVLKGAEDRHRA